MSYDFQLRDPVTHEELHVPGHLMYGGNIACEIDGQGRFIPTPTTEARLNITYNYARYYQEAFPPAEKVDETNRAQYLRDKETYGIRSDESGVKSLNGMSGVDAVPLLAEMIRRIEAKYKKPDGSWVITERQRTYYTSRRTGKIVDSLLDVFYSLHSPDETEQETWARILEEYEEHVETEAIDEGGRDETIGPRRQPMRSNRSTSLLRCRNCTRTAYGARVHISNNAAKAKRYGRGPMMSEQTKVNTQALGCRKTHSPG